MAAGREDHGRALSEYDRNLPRKRVSAGVLFFDDLGRVMLVDPIYKDLWEIPGGSVELNESPRAGAAREVKEELGLVRPIGRLLAVDWAGPQLRLSEGMAHIYDGGVLTPRDVAGIRLQPEELRAFEFVRVDTIQELLKPMLARRVAACVTARQWGQLLELENGFPIS